MRWRFAFLLLLGVGGCTLLDWSGLTSDNDAGAGPKDATADSRDEAIDKTDSRSEIDAPVHVALDALPPVDAPAEARLDVDAGSCHHYFCENFDDPQAFAGAWQWQALGDAQVTLEPAPLATSPTSLFHAAARVGNAFCTNDVADSWTYFPALSHITVELAFGATTAGSMPGDTFSFVPIRLLFSFPPSMDGGPAQGMIGLTIIDQALQMYSTTSVPGSYATSTLAAAGLRNFGTILTLDVDLAQQRASVFVGDNPLVSLMSLPTFAATATTTVLSLGVVDVKNCSAPRIDVSVRADDLWVDIDGG